MKRLKVLECLFPIIYLTFYIFSMSTRADLILKAESTKQEKPVQIVYKETKQKEESLLDYLYQTARQYKLDPQVVQAIIWIESENCLYSVNINKHGKGISRCFNSIENALKFANRSDNVDLGLMQINYLWWGKKLGYSKRELLDPKINIQVGCKILRMLLDKYKSYVEAVKRYHSSNPKLNSVYLRKAEEAYWEYREWARRHGYLK